jgi:hypothetical protein
MLQMSETAGLLEELRSAFPRPEVRRKHEDLVSTRSRLSLYRDEDFPQALGEVIEDSILSYPDVQDIEDVVRFLDDTGDAMGSHKLRKRTQERLKLKRSALEQLTAVQAKAIVAWLEHIAIWPELELDRDSIDAIRPYWSARAAKR